MTDKIHYKRTCDINDFSPTWLARQIGVSRVTAMFWARNERALSEKNQKKIIDWLDYHNFNYEFHPITKQP